MLMKVCLMKTGIVTLKDMKSSIVYYGDKKQCVLLNANPNRVKPMPTWEYDGVDWQFISLDDATNLIAKYNKV